MRTRAEDKAEAQFSCLQSDLAPGSSLPRQAPLQPPALCCPIATCAVLGPTSPASPCPVWRAEPSGQALLW